MDSNIGPVKRQLGMESGEGNKEGHRHGDC